jgi:hypothetical protein
MELKMKKVFAALVATLAFGAASAVTVVIDDFSVAQGPVKAMPPTTANPLCDNNGTREICENLISNPLNVNHGVVVNGGVNGFLNIGNEVLADSEVTLRWNIAPGLVAADAILGSFSFLVLASDSNPTNLVFKFGGATLFSGPIAANTLNQVVSFNAPLAALSAGGVLELVVNGTPGWDLALDNFGLTFTPASSVPVPGIAFLFGAGLLGLALRRKA